MGVCLCYPITGEVDKTPPLGQNASSGLHRCVQAQGEVVGSLCRLPLLLGKGFSILLPLQALLLPLARIQFLGLLMQIQD